MRRWVVYAAISLSALGSCSGSSSADSDAQPSPIAASGDQKVQAACDSGLSADVDGDGGKDRLNHAWVGPDVVLTVCLATGRVLRLDGSGGEGPLMVIDSNHDRQVEIVYGGTSVCGGGGLVAVVVDGDLAAVEMDGTQLDVWSGCDGPPEGAVAGWGCERDQLVIVKADDPDDNVTSWTRAFIDIEGTEARVTDRDHGTSTAPRDYKYSLPEDIRPPACKQLASA